VGFAAETVTVDSPTLAEYARTKLVAKNADLIVANDVAAPGVGFSHDTNAVLIVGRDDLVIDVPLSTKEAVAAAVADAISSLIPRTTQENQS
jgi:phosphopantothenoylcysteine decarboxylase/phosphopantothenate--cysteine ligase